MNRSALFFLALPLLVGCSKNTYEVLGTGKANIRYDDVGGVKIAKDVPLPWKLETRSGKLSLHAAGTGMLNCSITQPDKGTIGKSDDGSCEVKIE